MSLTARCRGPPHATMPQCLRHGSTWIPDARLGKDPVSFLLAMAPDTAQVGLLTDNWIIGGTL